MSQLKQVSFVDLWETSIKETEFMGTKSLFHEIGEMRASKMGDRWQHWKRFHARGKKKGENCQINSRFTKRGVKIQLEISTSWNIPSEMLLLS